jgi:hypothetical protein
MALEQASKSLDIRGHQLVKLNWPSVTIAARLRHCLCKEHDRGGGDR